MDDYQLPDDSVFFALCAPFPPEVVELKPGAVSEEKKRALALAYVDARHYQTRLDAVVGPDGWQVAYRPWGERAVICALTIRGVDAVRSCASGSIGEIASRYATSEFAAEPRPWQRMSCVRAKRTRSQTIRK